MDKNRIEGVSVGRAGDLPRSPYPSRTRSVDLATVHGRRLNLPQEVCPVSHRRLRRLRRSLTAGQKSAEGVVGHDVGKAREALQGRKAESTDRPSRERWPKARTRGAASRTWTSGTTRGRTSRGNWTSRPRQRVKPAKRGGKRPNRARRSMTLNAQLTFRFSGRARRASDAV
jgi:hypothetical protein